MILHILKLCVGCNSVEELAAWQQQRLQGLRKAGDQPQLMHVTRQMPRRDGFAPGVSSLYWVMGGFIRVRQRIKNLSEIRGTDGILRCGLVLDPKLIPTKTNPRRAFQGWRYLPSEEAPADLESEAPLPTAGIPPSMLAALAELRLL